MSFAEDFTLDDLDSIRVMKENKPAITAVRLGLLCTLYVKGSYEVSVRRALAACGDEYLRLFGDELSIYLKPDGEGRYLRYPKKGIVLSEYLQQSDSPEIAFAPVFSGGDNEKEASSYGLDIFAGSKNLSGEQLAYFYATVPFVWLKDQDRQQAFQKLVYGWCRKLQPYHGYAGIGAIQSMDMAERKRTSHQAYALAARFPGLEIDNPTVISLFLDDRVKGVNWLTALNDQCLERLGGRDSVLKQLDENFRIYPYDSGLLIQAGQVPQLGDANRRSIPRHYRKLSNIIKPLRMVMPDTHSFIRPLDGRNATDVTNEWLARFDD